MYELKLALTELRLEATTSADKPLSTPNTTQATWEFVGAGTETEIQTLSIIKKPHEIQNREVAVGVGRGWGVRGGEEISLSSEAGGTSK